MNRLLREMKEVEESRPPTESQLKHQLTVVKREMAKYQEMKSTKVQRRTTIQFCRERIWQRLLSLQEKSEVRIVHNMERYLGIRFRDVENAESQGAISSES